MVPLHELPQHPADVELHLVVSDAIEVEEAHAAGLLRVKEQQAVPEIVDAAAELTDAPDWLILQQSNRVEDAIGNHVRVENQNRLVRLGEQLVDSELDRIGAARVRVLHLQPFLLGENVGAIVVPLLREAQLPRTHRGDRDTDLIRLARRPHVREVLLVLRVIDDDELVLADHVPCERAPLRLEQRPRRARGDEDADHFEGLVLSKPMPARSLISLHSPRVSAAHLRPASPGPPFVS